MISKIIVKTPIKRKLPSVMLLYQCYKYKPICISKLAGYSFVLKSWARPRRDIANLIRITYSGTSLLGNVSEIFFGAGVGFIISSIELMNMERVWRNNNSQVFSFRRIKPENTPSNAVGHLRALRLLFTLISNSS